MRSTESKSASSRHDFERLLVDGHVHLHDSYDEARFFETACANLSRHGTGRPTLLLAEMGGQEIFARWRNGNVAWPIRATDEAVSFLVGEKLLVIAGRQIVTAERIEVLAIGCEKIPDGLTLNATIASVRDTGAVPVLPWGVGKWIGKRGRLVAKAAARDRVLLADNAGRPPGWPRPRLFEQHVILRGTDPLPLSREQERIGKYGFVLEGRFDSWRRPGQSPARCNS